MARRADDEARRELYGSGWDTPAQPQTYDPSPVTNKQLVQEAVTTHKETTDTTRNALRIVQETVEIQTQTNAALEDQGKVLNKLDDDFDRLGHDLTFADKLISFMRTCCCCAFFCGCLFEPERKPVKKGQPQPKQKDWRQGKRAPEYQQKPRVNQGGQPYTSGPGNYRDPDVAGLDGLGFQQEQAVLQGETGKQNVMLDEISRGLVQLKEGALDMQREVDKQTAHLDNQRADADELNARLKGANRSAAALLGKPVRK